MPRLFPVNRMHTLDPQTTTETAVRHREKVPALYSALFRQHSTHRPLARRRARTLRPCRSAMRLRNPHCLFLSISHPSETRRAGCGRRVTPYRFSVLGWYVRLMAQIATDSPIVAMDPARRLARPDSSDPHGTCAPMLAIRSRNGRTSSATPPYRFPQWHDVVRNRQSRRKVQTLT